MTRIVLCSVLLSSLLAWRPSRLSSMEESPATRELGALLQEFADRVYGDGFADLGAERDFDHGHLLYAPGARRPFAILYHTRELASAPAGPRNWLQWTDSGRVEEAGDFVRKTYPRTAYWAWFQRHELAGLRSHGTIVDRMLDPDLLGARVAMSRQWVFSRAACGPASLAVRLPGRRVCLDSRIQ